MQTVPARDTGEDERTRPRSHEAREQVSRPICCAGIFPLAAVTSNRRNIRPAINGPPKQSGAVAENAPEKARRLRASVPPLESSSLTASSAEDPTPEGDQRSLGAEERARAREWQKRRRTGARKLDRGNRRSAPSPSSGECPPMARQSEQRRPRAVPASPGTSTT